MSAEQIITNTKQYVSAQIEDFRKAEADTKVLENKLAKLQVGQG